MGAFGRDQGECKPGSQACVGGQWGPCTGETPPTDELCDGLDNNCDGQIDEGVAARAPDCDRPQGVCAGARATCRGVARFADCGPAEYGDRYVETETDRDCDGLDNDCDGQTDEACSCTEGTEQPCGPNVGPCRPGTQLCTHGAWGECRGAVGPADEACDGLDNNCDGRTDEGLPPVPCPLQAGVCAGVSTTCAAAAGAAVCGPEVYAAQNPRYVPVETADQCDGLDNDCDGLTDEACDCLDGATQVCGQNVGQCTQGVQTCTGGRFGECDGQGPAAEQCDGIDNNCDGRIDEGLADRAPACPLQVGVCAGARAVCAAGQFAPCGAFAYGPLWQEHETFCDGRDNNCNGQTDEGCDCLDNTVQVCGSDEGACSRGMQVCVGGRWGPCEGETPPTAEACNGIDDDCNGRVDDTIAPPACPLQAGICAGSAQRCGALDGFPGTCAAAEYGPRYVADETDADCDGIDNDCDGAIDEACECQPGGPRPVCGTNTGECRTGLLLCENGHFGQCEGEVPPVPETCNGLDDDCNAAIDDGLVPQPCLLQDGVCHGAVARCGGAAGFLACDATDYGPNYAASPDPITADRCDGRDNNCDGRVDEACPLPPVVISEVFYDGPGRDGPNEFIELTGPDHHTPPGPVGARRALLGGRRAPGRRRRDHRRRPAGRRLGRFVPRAVSGKPTRPHPG